MRWTELNTYAQRGKCPGSQARAHVPPASGAHAPPFSSGPLPHRRKRVSSTGSPLSQGNSQRGCGVTTGATSLHEASVSGGSRRRASPMAVRPRDQIRVLARPPGRGGGPVRPSVSLLAPLFRSQAVRRLVCRPRRRGRLRAAFPVAEGWRARPPAPGPLSRGPSCPLSDPPGTPSAAGQGSHSRPLHLPGIFHCSCLRSQTPLPGQNSRLPPPPRLHHTSFPPPARGPAPARSLPAPTPGVPVRGTGGQALAGARERGSPARSRAGREGSGGAAPPRGCCGGSGPPQIPI